MKKLFALAAVALTLCGLLTACGSKTETANDVDLTGFYNALAEQYGWGDDMMDLDGEMLEMDENDMLDVYGIQAADMKQFAAAVNTSGIDCDEVVLVEAKDADAASRVKEALDKRYQAKLNETENYLPDEYAVIKTCSVVMDGNYVAMIVAPNAADLVKIYNESFK